MQQVTQDEIILSGYWIYGLYWKSHAYKVRLQKKSCVSRRWNHDWQHDDPHEIGADNIVIKSEFGEDLEDILNGKDFILKKNYGTHIIKN